MNTIILDFDGTLEKTCTAIKTGKDTLKEMYAMGVILALTCDHEKKDLKNILDRYNIANYFSMVIAADDRNIANNDKNKFKAIVECTDSDPSQVMVVGENLSNLELGKEAGFKTCLIRKGKTDKTEGADMVINDLSALLDIV